MTDTAAAALCDRTKHALILQRPPDGATALVCLHANSVRSMNQ